MKTQGQLTDAIKILGPVDNRSFLNCHSRSRPSTALPALMLLLLAATSALAGSATWNLNATSGDFNWGIETNWTPATVPNGPADTATFDVSNTTDVFPLDAADREVNGIVFNAGASSFTFTVESFASYPEMLTISGVGIINNSGTTQNFVALGDIGGGDVGVIQFKNSATAGDLTTFTSAVGFELTSGMIQFADDSNGGTARVEVFGYSDHQDESGLDISSHNAPGVTIGSLEGDGVVTLGANNLAIGSNNLSTTFSGVIRGAGSLTKIGTGKLTLARSNKYSGGTVVNEGVLLINNKRASGTGTRAVQVNAGTLGGTGIIGGAVTVGTGSGSGAFLSPGVDAASHHTLAIRNRLTFDSDATYRCGFNSSTAHADKVVANGVTINSGAQFSFEDSNASALPLGTVFTVISNTASTPIAATFSNLADGSTFTVGSNTFQASYEGGDGNDLTLTVVP